MKILSTAHPRSGTGYMSEFYKRLGFDIPHEVKIGKDGISSWKHIARSDLKWDFIIHHVRSPLDTIISSWGLLPSSINWFMKHLNRPDLTKLDRISRASVTWLLWNELIESKEPIYTFRIEDIEKPDVFNTICRLLGIEPPKNFKFPPTNVNTRKHRREKKGIHNISWRDLSNLDMNIYRKVKAMSERYGYG